MGYLTFHVWKPTCAFSAHVGFPPVTSCVQCFTNTIFYSHRLVLWEHWSSCNTVWWNLMFPVSENHKGWNRNPSEHCACLCKLCILPKCPAAVLTWPRLSLWTMGWNRTLLSTLNWTFHHENPSLVFSRCLWRAWRPAPMTMNESVHW